MTLDHHPLVKELPELREEIHRLKLEDPEFRELFDGPLMGNCGYTMETAEAAVAGGAADLVAIGRPYISNPDLVERYRRGWPLAPESDPSTWYSGQHGAEGYTDFPNYSPEHDAAGEENS